MIFFLENKTYSSVRTEALSVIELLLKKLEGEFLNFSLEDRKARRLYGIGFRNFFYFLFLFLISIYSKM